MMKYTDTLLMIAAGFSLFSLMLVFSNNYFAGINELIPELFSGRATVTLSSTFHQLIASLVTGLLLIRYASKPIFIALLVALAINIEGYILLLEKFSIRETINYYQNNYTATFNLIKPLVILPLITYFFGLIVKADPPENKNAEL